MSANSNIVSSISSQKPSESRKVDISTRAFWFLFPLKFTNEYTFSYYYVPRTTSTNDLAFTLPLPKETGIQIISAEEQTAGRGQGNSSWESESGKNAALDPLGFGSASDGLLWRCRLVAAFGFLQRSGSFDLVCPLSGDRLFLL